MRRRFSRRAILGTLGAGAVGAAGGAWNLASTDEGRGHVAAAPSGEGEDGRPVAQAARQSDGVYGGGATKVADDRSAQIKGFADAASVNLGGRITFHVSVAPAGRYDIEIHRLGHRVGPNGTPMPDSQLITRSLTLDGVTQPKPTATPGARTVIAPWSPSWTLRVPTSWSSGHYLAVLTSAAGFRNHVPFVVRDDRREADFLIVAPYTTYQAYNQYPYDGRLGASLYHAWDARGRWQNEAGAATKVSFDRPYADSGLPMLFDIDRKLIAWAEGRGYDVAYATSLDLHAGRIDPSRHAALVFSGHDEYWSSAMRNVLDQAIATGVSVAFMAANSVYWHIRFEPSAAGVADRVVVCYKERPDPDADVAGRTAQWREIGMPEQRLLGAQYISMVNGKHPLTVADAGHWFWAGTGARDGDKIKDIVSGEADQVMSGVSVPTSRWSATLAASPYPDTRRHTRTQNTTLYQSDAGGLVFVAGTFGWSNGLSDTGADPRIMRATANLFDRMRSARTRGVGVGV